MMSCCRCIKRLEHVEKVIETYDPNETFLSYDLLTVWVNKKTKKAFILVSKENGIATWVPINADITTIDKIILNCGKVEANENNEIEHTGECGARTVTDDCKDLCITINTEWGLKGGGNVCAGESLTLGIDLANTTLVISSVKNVQDGDLVAFDGTSGKVIKKANNLKLGDAENSWNGKINQTTKALEFFPNALSTTPILSMLPNGVMLMPWQPKCTAKLSQRTPVFTAGQDYEIGSTLAFTKIRDTDGYNKSANYFFPGDGNGNYAYYTCPYTGGYNIGWLFLADRTNSQDTMGEIKFKLIFGTSSNEQALVYNYFFGNLTFSTVSGYITLPLNKGDRIRWNINIDKIPNGQPYLNSLAAANEIDNFIGILFLG